MNGARFVQVPRSRTGALYLIRGNAWIGTVWPSVSGVSWALLRANDHVGAEVSTIEQAKTELLAALALADADGTPLRTDNLARTGIEGAAA